MELRGGVVGIAVHMLLVCLILVQDLQFTFGRSTAQSEDVGGNVEVKTGEEIRKLDFTVHILTKRDAEEDSRPPGRTFKASEPLDPNSDQPQPQALSQTQRGEPVPVFEGFDTVDEIFQPIVEGGTEQVEDIDEEQDKEVSDSDAPEDDDKDESVEAPAIPQSDDYGAQYPYSESTRTSGQQPGGSNPDPYDQSYYQRSLVLTGGRGRPTTETEYVETEHGSSTRTRQHGDQTQTQYAGTQYAGTQYPSSGSSRSSSSYNRQYQTGSQYPSSGTNSQYYRTGSQYPNTGTQYTNTRTQYTGSGSQYPSTGRQYPSTGTQYSGYQTSGSSTRGARYDGPRYIDNNGHYIDANGRHLDSTGRYYDTSRRYQDASVTRTVTYQSGPNTAQRYTDASGQSFSYVDSTGGSGLPTSGSGTSNTYSSSGTNYGVGGGSGYTDQYGSSSTQIGGTPVSSFGGTQFYSGGQGYPASYDPVVSQISNDPNCPTEENVQVTINGLSCTSAVSQLGPFVCYNYERVNRECCERCLQVKRAENQGCEYGDRSHQCRNIQPFDCYNERNSQICCQRCQEYRTQRPSAISSCSFGDLTPRCTNLVQRSHLCYLPENQRLCCDTCPRLANDAEPDCKWGNQNPELCSEPFDAGRRLRLNCYLPSVSEICCSTCKSLKERIRETIPGCEYGDHPVQISTARGVLDCGEFIRYYGVENCDGGELAQKCCYTCYRYTNRQQG